MGRASWMHLGWLLAGCTVWNKVDVCEQSAAAPVTVNHRFEGIQKTSSPAAMVALPNGNAMVVFHSQIVGRSPDEVMEMRSVRLTPAGAVLPSCDRNDQLDDVLVAVDPADPGKQFHESSWAAAPLAAGRTGLITYRVQEADRPQELWGMFFQSDGCPFFTDSSRRKAFLIAQALPGEDLVGNSVVALGGSEDDFLVLWEELSLTDAFHAKARVLRTTPAGPQFLPTTLNRDGGVAVLPDIAGLLYSMAPALVGDREVAVAVHHGEDGKHADVSVWYFDDRLNMTRPPVLVTPEQERGELLGGRSVTAAFDGRTLLVGWLANQGTRVSLFSRALDPSGRPRSPVQRLSVGAVGNDGYPAAMAWKDHGFLIGWRQQDGGDTPGSAILGRLLDGSGQPVFTGLACGEEAFVVGKQADGDRRQPTLVPLRSQDVMAVWTDDSKSNADGSSSSIQARLLRAGGLFVGDELPGGAPGRPPVDAGGGAPPAGPDVRPPETCGPTPGGAKAGQPCLCAQDCEPGVNCITERASGIPGGICSKSCNVTMPDSCGPGITCRGNAQDAFCIQSCQTSAECGPFRICTNSACYFYCAFDEDCRSGHCDNYRSLCGDGKPLSGAGVYQPCLRDDDCRSRFCNTKIGRCQVRCEPERPNCPEEAVCVPFPGGGGGTCLLPCADNVCKDPQTHCYTDAASGKKGCL